MRSCRQFRGRLGRLLDRELPESEAATIRVHLALCPACSRAAASLQALDARLGELPLPPVPPGILARTMAQARRESLAPCLRRNWTAIWRSWPLAARLAACAAMVAACVLGLLAGSTAARSFWRPADRDAAILWMDAGSSIVAAYTGESR
jgi:anti-sigma factor RsiW